MRIAIMQPTYLPWLGYFDLMDQVDCFVLLDDVEFSRGSWHQRNRLKATGKLQWLTVPVRSKARSRQLIRDVELADRRFAGVHRKTIAQLYSRSTYYGVYADAICDRIEARADEGSLAALNIDLICWLADQLAIQTPVLRSSELGLQQSRGQRLVEICKVLGAQVYVSPRGALGYLRDDSPLFDAAGIRLKYHNYSHPEYDQRHPPFRPYASALDVLFNVGPYARAAMLAGRRRSHHPSEVENYD